MRTDHGVFRAACADRAGKETWGRIAAARVLLMVAALLLVVGGFVPQPAVHASRKKDRAEGAVLFKDKGCAHCHSVDGHRVGDGPDLGTVGKQLHKAQIEHQIRDGGKEMPAFGDMLTNDEVKKLVDYLAHRKKLPAGAETE
ncbi:MAG TPA: cytochrome c [Acidobacteriaceae bacterium]|jgi:mono/diheme cytochrome c family protein|nr:cytochrome c [Acidobacteriaceae bacterium]